MSQACRDLARHPRRRIGREADGMAKIFEIPLYPYKRSADRVRQPARHKVVVVGAGPIGMGAAIDLAQHGVETVVLDDNDRVSWGSRAICFAKPRWKFSTGSAAASRWSKGRRLEYRQGLFRRAAGVRVQPAGRRRPQAPSLHQPAAILFRTVHGRACRALEAAGAPLGCAAGTSDGHRATKARPCSSRSKRRTGAYQIRADYVIACDGANSPIRRMMGLDFIGRIFEDNFLIADIMMDFGRVPCRAPVLVRSAVQPRPVGAAAQTTRQCLARRSATRLEHRPRKGESSRKTSFPA